MRICFITIILSALSDNHLDFIFYYDYIIKEVNNISKKNLKTCITLTNDPKGLISWKSISSVSTNLWQNISNNLCWGMHIKLIQLGPLWTARARTFLCDIAWRTMDTSLWSRNYPRFTVYETLHRLVNMVKKGCFCGYVTNDFW